MVFSFLVIGEYEEESKHASWLFHGRECTRS